MIKKRITLFFLLAVSLTVQAQETDERVNLIAEAVPPIDLNA